jgi:hypothetical protein
MAKLADTLPPGPVPPTKGQILERLEHWSKELVAFERARVFGPLTLEKHRKRGEIVRTLDRWLDELTDQRGR